MNSSNAGKVISLDYHYLTQTPSELSPPNIGICKDLELVLMQSVTNLDFTTWLVTSCCSIPIEEGGIGSASLICDSIKDGIAFYRLNIVPSLRVSRQEYLWYFTFEICFDKAISQIDLNLLVEDSHALDHILSGRRGGRTVASCTARPAPMDAN